MALWQYSTSHSAGVQLIRNLRGTQPTIGRETKGLLKSSTFQNTFPAIQHVFLPHFSCANFTPKEERKVRIAIECRTRLDSPNS